MRQPNPFLTLLAASLLAVGCVSTTDEFVDEDSSELRAGEIGPDPSGKHTRYPILLTLGAGNTPNHWPSYGVVGALEQDGHVVDQSIVPVHGVEVRAEFVAMAIQKLIAKCQKVLSCDSSKVNIIAYSQGGLDARAVVHLPSIKGKVASVSMLSTPNRGSSIADVILNGTKPARAAAEWLVDLWTDTYSEPGFPKQDAFAAWEALATKNAELFNERYPDLPGILYQSWAGISEPQGRQSDREERAASEICEEKVIRARNGQADWLDSRLVAGYQILEGLHQETNDGLVTVQSAKWGQFRGCLPADHQDLIGRVADNERDKRTGFNHVRFYRNLAFELSAKGL